MKVLFAPDWRKGIPYQELLAQALGKLGSEVEFLSEYRRVLPFARGTAAHPSDLIHLHWPEAYFDPRQDGLDLLRRARFRLDLLLGTRSVPLVATAHNLFPHDRSDQWFVRANIRAVLVRAKRIMVHSAGSIPLLESTFGIAGEKCRVIPQGNLSVGFPPPLPVNEAAQILGITKPIGLMFGLVKPYKGIEGMIEHWRIKQPDAVLAIVGKAESAEYGEKLKALASGVPNIITRFEFLPTEQLHLWLSAARCVIFNYASIFNSGGAWLARSFGIPILLPVRATTVDLDEPHPLVIRFEEDSFERSFIQALAKQPDFQMGAEWRARTSWENVAKVTLQVYQEVL